MNTVVLVISLIIIMIIGGVSVSLYMDIQSKRKKRIINIIIIIIAIISIILMIIFSFCFFNIFQNLRPTL